MAFSQVRMLTAFSFSAAFGYLVAFGLGLPVTLCFVSSVMLALATHCVITDVASYRLNDWSLLAIGVLGLVAHLLENGAYSWAFAEAAVQVLLYGAQFELVRRTYQKIKGRAGLGFGDVKLAAAAGGWLSPIYFGSAVVLAATAAGISVLMRERSRQKNLRFTTFVPFGSSFAISIWLFWIVSSLL